MSIEAIFRRARRTSGFRPASAAIAIQDDQEHEMGLDRIGGPLRKKR